MPIDRANVFKPKLFKQGTAARHAGHQGPRPASAVPQGTGQSRLKPFGHTAQAREWATLGQRVEIAVQGTHRGRNAHVIVVQDDEQPLAEIPGGVHRLIGHTGCDRPIANDGNRITGRLAHIAANGKAKGRRNAGGAVRGTKGVVFRLRAFGEA